MTATRQNNEQPKKPNSSAIRTKKNLYGALVKSLDELECLFTLA